MENLNVLQAAAALQAARAERRTIGRVSDTFDIRGLDMAYAVAEVNTNLALAQGRKLSGKKVGLTSTAVQQQLGVDQPDFGVLFSDMEFLSGDSIPAAMLIQPKAEGEVAFVIERDMPDDDLTWGRFLTGLAFALPAIEIVDSVITDWRITLVDTVADNASCGVYVLGSTPRRISDLDLAACPMTFRLNHEVVSEGAGRACLGNPLYAAWWLAKTLVKLGQPLKAGDVVLSGALGPMVPIIKGNLLDLHIGGLGQVTCMID